MDAVYVWDGVRVVFCVGLQFEKAFGLDLGFWFFSPPASFEALWTFYTLACDMLHVLPQCRAATI